VTTQLTPERHLDGLVLRDWLVDSTARDCFTKGLSLSQALRADRTKTKLLLFAELKRVWRSVKIGEGKTWKTDEDLQDAIDDIVDIFRTLKVEEVQMCFRQIRRGEHKLFGRLDTPTVIEILRRYDTDVSCAYREAQNREFTALKIPAGILTEFAKGLPKPILTYEEALERGTQIPEAERKQMQERDKARRNL